MRQILCVVDLTESSLRVLELATRMAIAYQSQLAILFPYRLIDYSYKEDISKLRGNLEQKARLKFSEIKASFPLMDQVSPEFRLEIGFVADRVSSYVKNYHLDAIVISQRQANEMNEVNNMTFQNLITASKVPITIVPEAVDAEVSVKIAC